MGNVIAACIFGLGFGILLVWVAFPIKDVEEFVEPCAVRDGEEKKEASE
jgi:hypothetical protein